MRSAAPSLPLPADVRVMDMTARVVMVLMLLLVLAGAALWLAGRPFFALSSIRLEGDVVRNNEVTVRANAAPRLAGNYFTLDLDAARAAFEAVPWVRHAVVQRIWPNKLVVRLEEHRPVALWRGDEGNDRLVNSHGEIFEANVGDVEDDSLPTFGGQDQDAAAVWALYQRLNPLLARIDRSLDKLNVSERGSWTMTLDNAASIDMGRGSEDELFARVERFVASVRQVASRQQRAWDHADLRHADGYALRLRAPLGATND
ncbi:MAG: cell division protein FtsQ [Ideonella sp. MAG2]|nr:MAG: cell division protein FtsQ [Ideonella sp. MAG2]